MSTSSSLLSKKSTKLAVVVPVYNVARYLRECLDSLLSQTHRNFVVFAVDDGSLDESGAILDEFAKKDARIRVIHKENGGISTARNVALEAIENDETFDYIGFVDSDDKVFPEYLEILTNVAEENRADIVQCGFYLFNDEGKTKTNQLIQERKILSNEEFIECIFSSRRFCKTHFCGGFVWNKLFSASLINGLRFPHDRNVLEDEMFSMQAGIKAKSIAYIPDILYGYRQRFDSLVRSNRFIWQAFEGRRQCFEIAKKTSDELALVCAAALALSVVNLYEDAKKNPALDLKPYKDFVLRAGERKLIKPKVLQRFMFFCDHPRLVTAYRLNKE